MSFRDAGQVAYYDSEIADLEFEINRPHGESRFYRYLMDYKFQRVIELLGSDLQGRDVLAVCCGSGMDAEYLARLGARVVALDISHGCLNRARVRASRFGVAYELVRGDAERLPFRDGAFDYGFVHDGLHHLANPEHAVRELARIARRGIIVTEPAHANVTRAMIKLKIAQDYEEAGNYVARLEPSHLARLCRSLGFDRTVSSRYLIKYGHPPARWWRLLDDDITFGIARAAFVLLGVAAFGRWGNKLAFVAERTENS